MLTTTLGALRAVAESTPLTKLAFEELAQGLGRNWRDEWPIIIDDLAERWAANYARRVEDLRTLLALAEKTESEQLPAPQGR